MIFMPPQHGKTELAGVRFPAHWLERDPAQRVILGAYNQTYANKLSRKARRVARGRVALADDRAAVEEWETAAGGGLKAVGRGAGVTGNPGSSAERPCSMGREWRSAGSRSPARPASPTRSRS